MLFDSHAHVDDKKYQDDRDEMFVRAKANGVTGIINPGADIFSSARAVELADKYEFVYAAVGIHPHDAKEIRESDYAELAALAVGPKVVAIGEIGLDYFYDFSPREAQQAVLSRQLDLARQLNKPVIIHDHEAHADILAAIRNEGKGIRGVFHCFSGSMEMASEVLKLGFYISIAGPVTFSNAHKLLDIAKEIPLDKLLVETDSPYLTPHPHRGKRNEPANVRLVAEKIASVRGLDLEEFAAATTQNVRTLFNI